MDLKIAPPADGNFFPADGCSVFQVNELRLNEITLNTKGVWYSTEIHLVPWLGALSSLIRANKESIRIIKRIDLMGDAFDGHTENENLVVKIWDIPTRRSIQIGDTRLSWITAHRALKDYTADIVKSSGAVWTDLEDLQEIAI